WPSSTLPPTPWSRPGASALPTTPWCARPEWAGLAGPWRVGDTAALFSEGAKTMQTSRFLVSTAALALLAGLAAPVGAQQKMRPGLWAHSATVKSQSGQMEAALAQAQQSLASLSPAQRKQME